jgi:hypothetical protein
VKKTENEKEKQPKQIVSDTEFATDFEEKGVKQIQEALLDMHSRAGDYNLDKE